MVRIFVCLILIEGFLMAATLTHLPREGGETALIIEEDHALPIVSMQLVFLGSGSVANGKSAGLASLASDLLNEGTKKLGSVGFARALEERAIHINVNASREILVIELSALSEQFDAGLDLLIQLLKDPNLTESTVVKIKKRAISELSRKESDFDYVANVGLQALLYKGTILEQPTDGTIKSIGKITLKAIDSYLKTALVSDRAVLLFGGDLGEKEARERGAKLLAVLPKGAAANLHKIAAATVGKSEIVKKETQQAYIYFGSPFDLDLASEESYKATVTSFILGGGGFGSRIMEEIRVKRGLAYSASGQISLGMSTSAFRGHLQTKLESADEAQKLVRSVIADLVSGGANAKELEEAKRFLLGSEPLRNETMNQRLSRTFSDFYRGKPYAA
ncbi:peptidase M16 [Campylobacterota bacterium]|nr:peptidase M16 [Campylobacterota bacterium]